MIFSTNLLNPVEKNVRKVFNLLMSEVSMVTSIFDVHTLTDF